ncbi:MAG TPA: cyclase family protein [Myxococcota bacterium]|nr:cyclase family protein [Myxococcota bacterium]
MPTTRRLAARLVPLLLAAAACASDVPPLAGRLVDLTHPFSQETIYWPTEEGFVHEIGFRGRTEGGYYYEAHRFRAAEHGGTHVDAPIHFAEGAAPVDRIPLERLVAEGVRVDVSAACERDRDHAVTRAELEAFESAHGRIPAGSIVLLHTGFARFWPDRARYLGNAGRGAEAAAALHFPGLSAEAARWLADERRIAAVGIDTASIDPGPSRDFTAHQVLGARGVPAFENLANLDALPPLGFRVLALPMPIAGGSGAPLRAVAVVP